MNIPIIQVLDENTANKIAAGEVVERPASVIKELVENSIDAQSRNIEIEIFQGGTDFIRVTDDGQGMSHEDAKLAVLRHATSKIRAADDLASISSLGFRGEALPSIAAVSKFVLTTRLHNEALATYVEINGGNIIDIREAGGNIGTTITVSDLFYNTPARLKFLKTPTGESSHIHDILIKLALSHPDIAFKLINNNRLVLSTPGNGRLLDALTSIYGQKNATELIPINYEGDNINISGYLSKPTLLKSSRQWQTFIINLRVINSRFIAKALDNAYHSLLPKTGYPLVVLNIAVPLDTIDVNVHPQKSEIKFSDEQKIFKAVYHTVTEVLSSQNSPGVLAATVTPKFTSFAEAPVKAAGRDIYSRPIETVKQVSDPDWRQNVKPKMPELWQEEQLPLSTARTMINQQENTVGTQDSCFTDSVPEASFFLRPLGQVSDCYIVAQADDGLYVIDQHAAHERILYDRMSQASDRIPAQQLLVPLFIEFDKDECDVIIEHSNVFYQLGFNLDLIGPNTLRLSEFPADIPQTEAENTLRQILKLIQEMRQPEPKDLRHACLQMAACKAAIKAGEKLNMRQIQALIGELCATTMPYTCPHGRPAIIKFGAAELAKMFKRT